MLQVLEVYARRKDLQNEFPEVLVQDYQRLLQWAIGSVQRKWKDSDYDVLKSYAIQFESLLSLQQITDQALDEWAYLFRPVGSVRFGDLRRLTPISKDKFGWDRGTPIDRYYIERFLSEHTQDIRGRVLEIQDDTYTRKFGGTRVTHSDVLHVAEGNPKATIVADLTSADQIPSDTFDCIIITQTLQVIYDVRAALRHLYRILKPGASMLATFPGISHIPRYDMDNWGDYWRFTTLSARVLFEETFGRDNFTVVAHGNVLVATAFLYGLAEEELTKEELDCRDPDYEVTIGVRALKRSSVA
jgi:SAM-dependent methyltransferase